MTIPFSDTVSFLEALAPLREATFEGTDLTWDAADGTMRLALSWAPSPRGAAYRVIVTVRGAGNYRQSLTNGPASTYVLDRVECGRGGHELSFYFRPGDRAVMDVERIDGTVERTTGKAKRHSRPAGVNPLAMSTPPAARKGILDRLLGR